MKKYLLLLLVVLNLFQNLNLNAQTKEGETLLDSLQTALKNYDAKRTASNKTTYDKGDTLKVNILNSLSWKLMNTGDYAKAKQNADDALAISEKVDFKKGIANAYNIIGVIYDDQGNYPDALKNYFAALKIREDIGDKKGIGSSYNNIGMVYRNQGNYPEALKNHFASLKIYKEIGYKHGIGSCYINLGIINLEQGNYADALKNNFAALKIEEEIGDKNIIDLTYNNIGLVYDDQGNYPAALKNYFAALKIAQEIGDKKTIAVAENNIGDNYDNQGNYPDALKNYFTALNINKEIGDKHGSATCYINIGKVNTKLKKFTEAKKYLLQGRSLAIEVGSKEYIKQSYICLSELDSATGNWKDAYLHHKLYILYRDSLVNEENTKKIVQAQMQYQFDIKEATTKAEQDKKDAKVGEEEKKQALIRNGFIGGFALVLILAGVSYRSYRRKRKDNVLITKQKKEVEKQKQLVEEKNREITASINYALRIQTAILPSNRIVQQYLENSFIVYKPKDIVAGDFYWMETTEDLVLFAACDCTGHGVPGAMVSVVCHNALNRAVREFGLTKPSAILDKTNELVKENFSKSEDDIKDGMDISLCAYYPKTKTLQWSGANNPLWLFKNNELIETRADKQPIGKSENNKPFTNHEFKLNICDTIYIFSDGFSDQFGGEGEKKLTKKRFRELLLSIQNQTMQQQGNTLDKFITEYRKEMEQTDDILVMGVKIGNR
ncbi:MAG: tetratricopeptide repeat protein [Bacteroidia bacterium]